MLVFVPVYLAQFMQSVLVGIMVRRARLRARRAVPDDAGRFPAAARASFVLAASGVAASGAGPRVLSARPATDPRTHRAPWPPRR